MNARPTRWVSLVVALTAARGARADEAAVDEVVVVGEQPGAQRQLPGSATTIGAAAIERAQPYDLGEMLRRIPGVTARQEEGAGMRLDVGVRGLDPGRSRRLLVLVDGIPEAANPYTEPDLLVAPVVERMRGIEVLRGSGSLLQGPQTIGGVLNLRTIGAPDRATARVEVQGGDAGFRKVLGRLGDAGAGYRYVVQAVRRQGDGVRGEAFSTDDVLGKLVVDTPRGGTLTARLGFLAREAASADVGLTSAQFAASPRRPLLAPDDRVHGRKADVALTLEQPLRDGRLQVLAYAYETRRAWRRQAYARQPSPDEAYTRIAGSPGDASRIYFVDRWSVQDRSYQVAGLEPRVELHARGGGLAHTILVGGRVLVEHTSGRQETTVGASEHGSLLSLDARHAVGLAAYAIDRIAVGSWLTVAPGVRVEHLSFRRSASWQGGAAVDLSEPGEVTAVIPGVGLIVGSARRHVFAGSHVGFSPPRAAGAVSPRGETRELSAERSLHHEVGARAVWPGRARAELTAFLTSFQNQLVADPSDLGTGLTDGGATRSLGVEAAGEVLVARLASGPALTLGGRLSLDRATFAGGTNEGNRVPYAPALTAGLVADIDVVAGVHVQGAWSHTGAQFSDAANTVAVDATGRVGRLPAHDTLDLTARYDHARSGLGASLSVKNALDQPAVISRRPEGIAVGGLRQVLLGLRWSFEAGSLLVSVW